MEVIGFEDFYPGMPDMFNFPTGESELHLANSVNPQDIDFGVYDEQKTSGASKLKASTSTITNCRNQRIENILSLPSNLVKKETKCNESLIQLSLKESSPSSAQENSVVPTFVVTSRVKSTKPNLDLLFSLFNVLESSEESSSSEENVEAEDFSEFATSPGYDSYTESSSDSFADNEESLDSEFSNNWLSLDEISSHRSSLLSNFVECLN